LGLDDDPEEFDFGHGVFCGGLGTFLLLWGGVVAGSGGVVGVGGGL
jgi:hypothetical protein